ncbi:MAG: glycoside hydrolase family 3 C-terminal domain-containing protein, partial [Pseudomonadota bacterium]|nr:glycoside hydrolase family 3 C-terminal domain-containing protein [Pseudomonadota bacterium]
AQETYGESPRLTGALAKEYVAGLQGNHPRYVQVVATPKHFDAYGGATSRGHRSPTEVTLSWRDLHETFQPQFRAVLSPSNNSDRNVALSTMCSYNTLCVVDFYNQSCPGPSHGVPACADSALLTALLRDTWNFTGYVISDAGAIKFIETDHEWASSQPIAAAEALKAGADMALGGGCSPSNSPPGCISFGALGNATTMGLITIGDIDQALSRVLRARFRLGLMDPGGGIENPYTAIKPSIVDCSEHRALALQAARESVVLLENPIGFLPLLPKPGLRVAIVGPNANVKLFGNYNGDNANFTTILAGIRRVAPLGGYALGCGISSNSTAGFAEAIAVAEAADVVVMAIGIDQSQEHETGTRNAIELPGVQAKLVQEIHSTGRPVVVVLAGGSAMAVPWVKNFATATVWAGYGGEEAGTAIAEVLFGLAAPSGKLPITFYAETGQLPPFSSYDMARTPGRTFRYLTEQPLWAFGHGL